jgi:hypothetical protein
VEMLWQVRITSDSRLASSVEHCAGPSTESVRKAVKTETKKKAATTRKGRGRTKTSNCRFLAHFTQTILHTL